MYKLLVKAWFLLVTQVQLQKQVQAIEFCDMSHETTTRIMSCQTFKTCFYFPIQSHVLARP